jgi:predicted nucleic acid-binding protein
VRVYAESNFVLETALEQEEHEACDELVLLAGDKRIELVLPAFALIEPHHTLVRRRKEKTNLGRTIQAQMKQLERTASMKSEVSRLSDAADLLLRAEQQDWQRLLAVRARLLSVARLATIDRAVYDKATTFTNTFGLDFPDAVHLAAVLADAATTSESSIFLNRNKNDFNDADIVARLRQVGCDLITSFQDGLRRIKHTLTSQS